MRVQATEVAQRRRALVDEVKHMIIGALQLALEPDEIAEDCPLFGFGLGLDSIDALTLVVAVEAELGVEVLDADIQFLTSVNGVADFVDARRTA